MKKLLPIFLCVVLVFSLAACGSSGSSSSVSPSSSSSSEPEAPASDPAPESEASEPDSAPDASSVEPDPEPEPVEGKTLVVYFSASGNTAAVANIIAEAAEADLFELVPAEPYSDADLNWRDQNSRVVYEYSHPEERDTPLVSAVPSDWGSYDTVFIGYPIWWANAAWPVDGFIAANDFTGKTVIPFCTSTTLGLGESGKLLADAAGTGTWLEGTRFSEHPAEADVIAWVEGLGL